MKRMISLLLAAVLMLSLAACGGSGEAEVKEADLNALYETMLETTPEMLPLDETMMLNMFGIQAEDCVQVVTAICTDGLRTDEIWLIEAKDAEALERLTTLAQNRLNAKAEETVTYSPEQYAVVEKAELLTEGMYLALLVSPDVETLKTAFESAVK